MRQLYQGLFLAPHIVMEALKGAVFCARVMELAGYEVLPKYDDKRSDIIQAIKFGDREKLIKFCKGIQKGSPIDSFVECEPWAMPGYNDEVIMAAGAFIQVHLLNYLRCSYKRALYSIFTRWLNI